MAVCPNISFSRRAFLHSGTAALFGGAIQARVAAAGVERNSITHKLGRAKSCILVYLLGGPPHLDMWDMKPGAPAEVRGPFKPIQTAVPGFEVCEHLPGLAARAEKLAVVRSLSFPNNDHPFMIYYTLTGRVSPVPLGANTVLPPSRRDHPHLGSVVARFKPAAANLPAYVAVPELRVRMQAVPVSGGGRAGFLGPRYDPLAVNDDPGEPVAGLKLPEEVTQERFADRARLLALLEGTGPRTRGTTEYGQLRDSAGRLIRSVADDGLFDLKREPEKLKERYGDNRFGRSMLLARRLVERGVPFVAIHFNYMSKCDGWDTHANNFKCLEDELLPTLDTGLAALLDDLGERGLADETLVVTMGEFGRTPKINANAGRDHWGSCGSALFAGGGVQGGRLVGRSDKLGAYPAEQPVAPEDVVATIYHALGIDPARVMYDAFLDRPMVLSEGRVVEELF